ncbi:AAA family ATPase [Pseudomonas sp. R2.Fl]|nr:AAA family ATPase [Pseudomonas sp. R2.Fl]
MKIHSLEMSGFRGVRDSLRIEFSHGFTLLTGRNGVGKSTIFDAIEFAISGKISKYAVEKSGLESVTDYIWWRGEGGTNSGFVKLVLMDDHGATYEIHRERNGKSNLNEGEIEKIVCNGLGPENSLEQLCRTSIIRDELISAHGVDLSESERFELVRSSLGSVEGPDWWVRTKQAIEIAKNSVNESAKEYERDRAELEILLTQMTEVRNASTHARDVKELMDDLSLYITGKHDEISDLLRSARESIVQRRVQLNRSIEIGQRYTSYTTAKSRIFEVIRAEYERAAFRKFHADKEKMDAEIALRSKEKELAEKQESSSLASSLALLVSHGEKVGLLDGCCPLCASSISSEKLRDGMETARRTIERLSVDLQKTLAERDELRVAFVQADEGAREAKKHALVYEEEIERFRMEEDGLASSLLELDFDISAMDSPEIFFKKIDVMRSELFQVERLVDHLDSSRLVAQTISVERRVNEVRERREESFRKMSRAQDVLQKVVDIEKESKRVAGEFVDEKLAQISPLLRELYSRLRPHSEWKSIDYAVRGDIKRLVTLRVGSGLNPQFMFSSGQRRAVGLAFLLSVHLSRAWVRLNTLILDDPVQHIDDYRALQLAEVLSAIAATGKQVICSVEDDALADLFARRLSGAACPGLKYTIGEGPGRTIGVVDRQTINPLRPNTLGIDGMTLPLAAG